MTKSKAEEQNNCESLGELAFKALVSANAKLVLRSRQAGRSLVIWRDGKVCNVPASELDVPTYPEDDSLAK